ncbi:MAG: 16S rRNA processing protein RimM [Clostridia bacterium]|nr:16S rRNA processing protein RimM [Clostridia bacterium]
MKQDYLLLGEIVRPQGIRGEVKVRHYTDDPDRFHDLDVVFLKRGDRYEQMTVTDSRVQGDDVYLKLEGIDDRNEAEKLRNIQLWVDRENAVELGEDEVFIADILGAKAFDTKGNPVGVLKDVLTPGGVDVFVLKTPKGTLMFPALKEVLLEMNADEGRLVLDENKLEEVALYEDRHS